MSIRIWFKYGKNVGLSNREYKIAMFNMLTAPMEKGRNSKKESKEMLEIKNKAEILKCLWWDHQQTEI